MAAAAGRVSTFRALKEPREEDATSSDPARESARPVWRHRLKTPRRLLQETIAAWIADNGPERGAALSFYVVLSLGPLLTLFATALELLPYETAVRPMVIGAVTRLAGPRAAETADTVMAQVEPPDLLAAESIVTLGTLAFAATAAFANVRGALNAIWDVAPEAESLRDQVVGFLHTRWRSFVMLVATGAIVTVSFVLSSAAAVLYGRLRDVLSVDLVVVQALDATLSAVILGVLFGVLYRTLPDVRIEWSSVWVGAFGTAVLFVVGKALLAGFIGSLSWTSYYGPGTSVVVFLAWVYFSAQLFYLGAEFTQVWSRQKGGVLDSAGPAAPH